MKIITSYQCEICKKIYHDEKEAVCCEEKGAFVNKYYPPGLMFEYTHHGFVGIFAIPDKIKFEEKNAHYGYTSYWACRAEGYPGDSLGKDKCGGDYFYSNKDFFDNWVEHHHIANHIDGPEFKRMVDFLKGQGIQPCYYNKAGELIKI